MLPAEVCSIHGALGEVLHGFTGIGQAFLRVLGVRHDGEPEEGVRHPELLEVLPEHPAGVQDPVELRCSAHHVEHVRVLPNGLEHGVEGQLSLRRPGHECPGELQPDARIHQVFPGKAIVEQVVRHPVYVFAQQGEQGMNGVGGYGTPPESVGCEGFWGEKERPITISKKSRRVNVCLYKCLLRRALLPCKIGGRFVYLLPMSLFTKIKNFAKNNWSFGALVLLPIARLLWRAFVGDSKKSGSARSVQTGDTYKKGDVIDIEVKK